MRPLSVNQRSLYRVGAARTKGCANPVRIWPNITTPKVPWPARVPAYRIQFPISSRPDDHSMDSFGPRWRVHIVNLVESQELSIYGLKRSRSYTYGEATTKANKNPVDNQLIVVSLTLKYVAAVADTGANVNHCIILLALSQSKTIPLTSFIECIVLSRGKVRSKLTSQLTTMFKSANCNSPHHLLL